MMSSLITTLVAAVVIVTIAGVGLGSYYYGLQGSQSTTPGTNLPLVPPGQLTSPPPLASASPLAPTTAPIKGITTVQPTPTLSPTPRPLPTPTPSAAPTTLSRTSNTTLGISFVDTPSHVRAGESFIVQWHVTGPAGTNGQKTALKLSYQSNKSYSGSSSSVSNNNSTSFGPFTVPKVFSSKFSFGSDPATIHLTATAEVSGQTLTTTKDIALTN